MQLLNNTKQMAEQPEVQLNDSLKEHFGPSPLFPEKLDKAKRVMKQVREKQQLAK